MADLHTGNIREIDTPAQAEVRHMLTAAEIATRPENEGFHAQARAVLAEIRKYDEQFGRSDGIAAAVIAVALWKSKISGLNECRSAVAYAFDKAGIPSPRARALVEGE